MKHWFWVACFMELMQPLQRACEQTPPGRCMSDSIAGTNHGRVQVDNNPVSTNDIGADWGRAPVWAQSCWFGLQGPSGACLSVCLSVPLPPATCHWVTLSLSVSIAINLWWPDTDFQIKAAKWIDWWNWVSGAAAKKKLNIWILQSKGLKDSK